MPSAVAVLTNTPLESLIGELPARVALLVAEGSPRQIKDAADYLRTQLRRAGLAFEVRNAAAQAWLELEAGCGAKLAGNLRVGAPSKTVRRTDGFKLEDVGISRNLSSRMQAIAAIPQRDRREYYMDAQANGWEITWAGENGLRAHANPSQIISPVYPVNDLSNSKPWQNNRSPLAPRTIRPQNDDIHTDPALPKRLVKHFQPSGLCLDCCRGVRKDSAFYNSLPQLKDWCEVKLGRDFLAWTKRVSWIFTNPPWSSKVYRAISQHCFEVADNVVLLTRLHNAIGTYARHHDWLDRGHGLKEVVIVKWEDAGFPLEGFVLGAFHWRLGHNSGTTWTYWD